MNELYVNRLLDYNDKIILSINSDDPAFFNVIESNTYEHKTVEYDGYISSNYLYIYNHDGLSIDDIIILVMKSIDSLFITIDKKKILKDKVNNFINNFIKKL